MAFYVKKLTDDVVEVKVAMPKKLEEAKDGKKAKYSSTETEAMSFYLPKNWEELLKTESEVKTVFKPNKFTSDATGETYEVVWK